jgi:alanine-synthesizing transaminase
LYRYSNRLDWVNQTNPISTLIAQQRASGRELLDLTEFNPTEALAAYPHAEMAVALGSIRDFRYQPTPFGDPATREAIVSRLREQSAESYLSPAHVALTASTSEAYGLLFKLLANPGDEVLVPLPSYPLFEFLARFESVKFRPYRLAYDGSWFIDFESLEEAASSTTRAIVLVNPNNPTGSFLKRWELEKLQEFALRHELPIICDEVFMDYGFAGSADRIQTIAGTQQVLSFSLNGLSKSAGMPQMKLGWIIVNGPLAERERACARLELILDTYLSVNGPVQLASEHLFHIGDGIRKQIQHRLERNLLSLSQVLRNSALHALHLEGGWSAILRVPQVITEEQWITRLLMDQGVIVQPGYFFDMPGEGFLVVSLLPQESEFTAGIEQILIVAKAL